MITADGRATARPIVRAVELADEEFDASPTLVGDVELVWGCALVLAAVLELVVTPLDASDVEVVAEETDVVEDILEVVPYNVKSSDAG